MSQDLELFDTHAHLGDDGCPDEAEYYRRAEEAGVPWIPLCGSARVLHAWRQEWTFPGRVSGPLDNFGRNRISCRYFSETMENPP